MNEARTIAGRMIGAAGRALGVRRAAREARRVRRRGTIVAGFTLIEVLVAVGAVAIVAVGLAAIFDAVGKTVTGGRRVNTLNQAAAVLESQMRQDFAAMTRDGFLVIRQQFADANNDRQITRNQDSIPLAPNEPFPRWRIRRIDEIMFYTRGDFASAREPLHPSYVAKSDSARVYYGHGQRRIDDLTPDDSLYLRPSLADSMGDLDGSNSKLGRNLADNPNRFASDWSLLRLQTVLADPATANQNPPQQPVFDLIPRQPAVLAVMLDRDYQVALLPAAASIFRTMSAERYRLDLPGQRVGAPASPSSAEEFALWSQAPRYTGNMTPVFASGLVDVATTSLEEIRSVVMQMNGTPADMVAINDSAWGPPPTWTLGDPIPAPRTALWAYPATNLPVNAAASQMRIARAWMDNAMPTKSDITALVGGTAPPGSPDLWPGGIRVRYEPEPPDYMGVITDQRYSPPANGQQARTLAQLRADQLMLSSNNFLPRCTEFQIEWSFGQMNDNQQVIWYGGWQTDATGVPTISRYSEAGLNGLRTPFRRTVDTGNTQSGRYLLDEDVLYGTLGGAGADQPNPTQSLTTYFGYVDTTFNPTTNSAAPGTVVAWPWPKMFRVTIRLSDPRDPRIEETFQFVFESPER
jgi:prepilin-type N-terminal cleavage/methylation domain-containing protein